MRRVVSPCAAEPARLRLVLAIVQRPPVRSRSTPSALPSPQDGGYDRPALRQRRPAAAWRARAALARRADDAARRGHHAGDRHRIRARRVFAPPRPSLLVPVVRRRHGHGLAFVGDHDLGHRRAEARARAAFRRTRPPCLRRPRRAFAENPARARRDRRQGRLRRGGARDREPARRQGRQRRGAGRLRPLPARLHRRRRRPLGRGAAGHERRAAPGAPLPLAVRGPEELRRGAAQRDRRRRAGGDRQPDRRARGAPRA